MGVKWEVLSLAVLVHCKFLPLHFLIFSVNCQFCRLENLESGWAFCSSLLKSTFWDAIIKCHLGCDQNIRRIFSLQQKISKIKLWSWFHTETHATHYPFSKSTLQPLPSNIAAISLSCGLSPPGNVFIQKPRWSTAEQRFTAAPTGKRPRYRRRETTSPRHSFEQHLAIEGAREQTPMEENPNKHTHWKPPTPGAKKHKFQMKPRSFHLAILSLLDMFLHISDFISIWRFWVVRSQTSNRWNAANFAVTYAFNHRPLINGF